ncbi:MAG TPA: hypothetical protein VFG03_19075 [Telluria sp.]|nr:hypothetical protein [Telluria sp.]
MRRTLLVLTPLLLAGCVDQSASYAIDGNSDQALTVRAEQEYFWSDDLTLRLIVSRMPDCQRQYSLATLAAAEAEVELYASGDNLFTLRAGKQAWQVDAQTCVQTPAAPQDAPGEKIGSFKIGDEKMLFEPAPPAAAAVPAPAAPAAAAQ